MFVSIVSHGHANLIIRLDVVRKINEKYNVIITDNISDEKLKDYCEENSISYIPNKVKKGFGENNNQNYKFAKNNLGMNHEDFFLILNPDIEISMEELEKSLNVCKTGNIDAATINLIKDNDIYDYNVRRFPKLINFIESYLFNKNSTIIDKNKINDNIYVDWASGSFLLIKSKLYEAVCGFDEKYFMYCEDLDICKRIYVKTGTKIYYIHNIIAKHYAAHNNRRLLSKHFLWHLKSILRYCLLSKY